MLCRSIPHVHWLGLRLWPDREVHVTGWKMFIDNLKWNYPIPLLIFGIVVVVYFAQRVRGGVDNLILWSRIKDRLPLFAKIALSRKDREIAVLVKRVAELETAAASFREAARGAVGYLTGFVELPAVEPLAPIIELTRLDPAGRRKQLAVSHRNMVKPGRLNGRGKKACQK